MPDDRGARKPPDQNATPPTPRRIVLPKPRLTPQGTQAPFPRPPRVPPAATGRTERMRSAVHPRAEVPQPPKLEKPQPIIAVGKAAAPEPEPKPDSDDRPSNIPTPLVPPPQTIVIVGSGFDMIEALVKALGREGLQVETVAAAELESSVIAMAPDLIVLLGDAATDGGRDLVSRLAASKMTSSIPVILVTDSVALELRLRAFRHGVAAVIPASASVHQLAAEIADLSHEIPERDGITRGNAGRTTLNDLVDLLGAELKTGILKVSAPGEEVENELQLVLGEGRPIAALIDEFVGNLRQHVVSAEPLVYEFDERAGGSVTVLGADSSPAAADEAEIAGLRIVIADDDAARADAVAQALRRQKATVVVTDLAPEGPRFERLRMLDPAIMLVGERQLQAGGSELVRRMRDDTRLRWVSLLVVRWDEVWPTGADDPKIDTLLGAIAGLVEPDRFLLDRVSEVDSFDTRLEIIGPARLLRALAGAKQALRVTVQNPRVSAFVDLKDGLVVGAEATLYEREGAVLAGYAALAALLVLSSGRVKIERIENPVHANVMDPVETALNQALSEDPPIPASRPHASGLGNVEAALSIPPGRISGPSLAEDSGTIGLQAVTQSVPAPVAEPAPGAAPRLGKRSRLGTLSALVGAIVVLGLLALFLSGRLSRSPEATPAPNGAATAAAPDSTGEPAQAKIALLERVRAGDVDSMKELEARPQESRSVEESLALAAGRVAQKRAELDRIREAVARDPSLAEKAETIRALRSNADDPAAAPAALRAMAELPGPRGADLLYDIWTGTNKRTETTRLAEELVNSEEVRKKASPPLAIALELRRVKDCEQAKGLLVRAEKEADRRSLRPLARLLKETGCGKTGARDCFACLRKGAALNDALAAAEKRPPPEL